MCSQGQVLQVLYSEIHMACRVQKILDQMHHVRYETSGPLSVNQSIPLVPYLIPIDRRAVPSQVPDNREHA